MSIPYQSYNDSRLDVQTYHCWAQYVQTDCSGQTLHHKQLYDKDT